MTWVKESNVNDLSFEGYNFVSNHRANKIGGERTIFVLKKYRIRVDEDLRVIVIT